MENERKHVHLEDLMPTELIDEVEPLATVDEFISLREAGAADFILKQYAHLLFEDSLEEYGYNPYTETQDAAMKQQAEAVAAAERAAEIEKIEDAGRLGRFMMYLFEDPNVYSKHSQHKSTV